MSGVIIIELHQEIGEIGAMLGADTLDQLLRRYPVLLGAQHDGGAMGIIGADIDALMAPQLLEAHPDIGLDVFHHMAQVKGAVGIRQGAGN